MYKFLKEAEIDEKDIKKDQLIIVKINDGMYLYNKNNLEYKIEPVYIGKNGVTFNKQEGDGKTPLGLYDIGFAFGTEDLEGKISYQYRKITENSYWVDDINSDKYNQWVELNGIKEWNSAEHLIEFPVQYKYGLVIEYNTKNIIKNAGSAIFLHVAKNLYTAGCIAIKEEDMLRVLKWIRDAHILIMK